MGTSTDQIIRVYSEILEKTNQQLGLWTNPYGLMVGVLAVLFTILTIIATIIIYRQSKDYKEKIQTDREQYAKSINDFLVSQKTIIDRREKQAEQVEEKINELLKGYEKQLNTSSENQKAEIEKVIADLKDEKSSLLNTIGPITVSPNNFDVTASAMHGLNSYHGCKNCGFGFFINKDNRLTTSFLTSNQTVTCPKCGNVDLV